MQVRGTYQKTLTHILFTVASVMALLISLLTGSFLERQTRAEYTYHLEQSAKSQESSANMASNVILNTILKCASNQDIIRWANSAGQPNFYFNAITASKALRETISNILPVEYECALVLYDASGSNDEKSTMVLTHDRTLNVPMLLDHLQMTQEEYDDMTAHFSESDQPYFLPRYRTEDQELKNIIYIRKSTQSINPFLIFVTIPRETFISSSDNDFFLYNGSGIFAYSQNTPKFQEECRALYDTHLLPKSSAYGTLHKTDHGYMTIANISPFQWMMATSCPAYKLPTETLIFFFALVFAMNGLFIFISYRLVARIYRPMKELLESAPMTKDSDDGALDEFALLRRKMDENYNLVSIKAYKDLLFTRKPDISSENFQYPDASYCVALGETMDPDEDNASQAISIQKAAAYDLSVKKDHVIYIDLDYNRYALIIRTDSLEDTKTLLTELLSQLEDQENLSISDHRIVISDIHKGLNQLYLCYHEAMRILEFRYLHARSRLITYADISSIDATTYYSYPLQTENRLIQCILDGKDEALSIFDDVVRENIANRDLSKENLQNLIYAFIGTISRIFQELKTTPEDFLDDSVNYKYLYNHWNDAVIFMKLKNILEAVLTKIKQQEDSRDQDLLNQMLNYIYENYWDDIMLNDLADHLNISPKYCGILFKQLSDNNFKDFLNRYRIEKAKEILRENPSIKIVELSSLVGFNSSNSFIRVFSKYEGITPGAYLDRIQHS